jgi:sugar/nucleoside kinase (ribokinase family)
MADEGCLAVSSGEAIRVYAPEVQAVDGCGAGATFSAGYIYGYLLGWDLEKSIRFATAAASLKVTRPGLQMFPIHEIMDLAGKLSVEKSILPDQDHQ